MRQHPYEHQTRVNPEYGREIQDEIRAERDALDAEREALLDAADEAEQDDSPYCECDNELTWSEIDSGRCAGCGKKVTP